MGLNTSCFLQLLIISMGCLRGSRAHRTERPFPECRDVQTCGMVNCRKVPIPFSHDAGYSPQSVMCIDNNSSASYLLTRCPNGFFNTFQDTSGVCSISDDNGTKLLLRAKELVPGLHPFDCLINDSNNSVVYSSAIVANDDVPYRDVLVYINSTLQQGHHNNTNVTVDLGDSLTVAVRGVGNISMINASDPRFICETNFACNMQLRLSAVSNRGVECSLRTPVELSDNGRTLTVILSKMEQINITITVNDRPLLPPPPSESVVPAAATSAEHHPQPTSIAAPVITSSGRSTDIEPTVTSPVTTSSSISSSIVPSSFSNMGQAIPIIPPSSGKGSEGVPAGVIAAIIVAVIFAVVVILIGTLIFCIHKKRVFVHKEELHDDATKHAEEARGAPPITCSRSSSLKRSSITSMDGQQLGTSSTTIDERLKDIRNKLDHNIEITEEVNTGVNALKIDNTKSLKRQTSAS